MNPDHPFVRNLDGATLDRYPALYDFLLGLGESPLMTVPGPPNAAPILAKCEWANPNGTVKDRAVFGMVYRTLRRKSRAGLHLLEYTGGSLGLSLSRVCAALGVRLTLVLSDSAPHELLAELRSHGTSLVLVAAEAGFGAVMDRACALAVEQRSWTFLHQHRNPANLWMHRETTGPEIAAALPSTTAVGPCAWIASIGTGATFVGVRECLRKVLPNLSSFATTPAEQPYGTPAPSNGRPKFIGSGGLGSGRRQTFVEPLEEHISGHIHLGYEQCLLAMRDFNRLTGLRIGSSAAANWLASREVATTLGPGATVITVFPSAASNYEWERAISLQPTLQSERNSL